MASKMPKEDVAQLLKQLEELKRKKAYKERKLQKLKNCSIQDMRKGQVCYKKTPDSEINNGTSLKRTSANLLKFDKSSSQSNTSIEKSYSVNLKDSKVDNSSIKLDEENHDSKSFNSDFNDQIVQNYSEGEIQKTKVLNNQEGQTDKISSHVIRNIAQYDSVEKDACKSYNLPMTLKRDLSKYNAIHVVEENFLSKKHKSSVSDDNDDNFKFNNENCYSNVPTSKDVCDGKTIKSPTCDRTNGENLELNVDHKIILVPKLDIDSKLNSSHHDQKSSDNSSKSISNGKGHTSDLLDDSLNANMSCFLSPDLFDNHNIDEKELNSNLNDISKSLKISECPKSTENVSVVFNQKTSPVGSNSPLNAIKKNTYDFSFPKFSTPTDLNFVKSSDEENIRGSLSKKELQKTCKFVENMSDLNENIHLLDEGQKQCISPQKFSPSKIDCILGKGLSSVLDAQFESPKKLLSGNKNLISVKSPVHSPDLADDAIFKKERLFQTASFVASKAEQNAIEYDEFRPLNQNLNNSKENSHSSGRQINDADLDFCNEFPSNSGSFSDDLQDTSALANDSDEVPSQVIKAVDVLVNQVCEDCCEQKKVMAEQDLHFTNRKNEDFSNNNQKPDSEILIVPETEGLELFFSKDTQVFLETSTLSQNMEEFHENETLLNMSSQSKLTSPVVNNIVASVKLARTLDESHTYAKIHKEENNYVNLVGKSPEKEEIPADNISAFDNSLGLDTSFLEEDTQTLGNFKQVPYMNEINVQEKSSENDMKIESNLSFVCSLYGEAKEPVLNVEIVIFGGVKYAFIQQARQIHVWRQEKNIGWIKIFSHHIEDMLLLVQICVTMDEDNLVIVMLLTGEEKYCLQFLLFEKDTKVIKLMENTHWLENSDFKGSILLCGLNGLMFATAQNKANPEVSLHAFVSLKENPRLMTAVLESTDNKLCSLCKIDKLPNALMGISGSMLYVWHILEARLVTAVTLHPVEYLPIKECFWATVENGLVYFLTTCEGEENHQVCQLLAANLATGFCQMAMTYSTRPSSHEIGKINKAIYLEPFLVVAHSNGAFMWSVTEEFCCAALYSESNVTTTAISKDFENWGLLALGFRTGYIDCYSLN